jgi:hypothetical protein
MSESGTVSDSLSPLSSLPVQVEQMHFIFRLGLDLERQDFGQVSVRDVYYIMWQVKVRDLYYIMDR